jgi:G3E family GTPase
VKSIYFSGAGSLSKEKLEPLMGTYLWEATNILRCKGIFYDGTEWQMLQGVGEMFEFRPCAPLTNNDQGYRFLFVGRDITQE